MVGCQPYTPAAFSARIILVFIFRGCVDPGAHGTVRCHEKNPRRHLESIPGHSELWCSALTTTLPQDTIIWIYQYITLCVVQIWPLFLSAVFNNGKVICCLYTCNSQCFLASSKILRSSFTMYLLTPSTHPSSQLSQFNCFISKQDLSRFSTVIFTRTDRTILSSNIHPVTPKHLTMLV